MPEVRVDKDNSGPGFVYMTIDGIPFYVEINEDKNGTKSVGYIETDVNEVWMTLDDWRDRCDD